jgi:Zn-dependent protease with chaperone function
MVLNIAGVYYYISLPVVFVLVIGIVGVIFYLFLMIGRIPIKLMFILGIGALVTIVAMIKSLFIRVKASDPGRALQPAEAEGLWQLAKEVAESVGTRPIDEIRITPGTELAVYERGTWRQKLRNEARRILILGTGVLNGFKQNDFRCVLAHEYGHFSNRDTAGGDIALRVQNDMLKFYFAMREAGQATFFNAAFHFLRIYNFIFRRISHGATRLQEILADRVAAQIYGAPAFEGGLRHVIKRSLEFEAAANLEIKQSLEAHRPLQNLYGLPAPQASEIALAFEKTLNRLTTEDDTHPSPRDRFELVAPLQEPACAPREGEVWDLFADPEAIRREMVATIEKRIGPHRGSASSAA